MYLKTWTKKSTVTSSIPAELLREALTAADAVVVGAGSGLSASAGLTYSGARFERYFGDFQKKYGIRDMYSGGFFPFDTLEEHWAWWSRHIMVNRYERAPKPVYEALLDLLREKEYFVLTTNVDHQFQLAGFDQTRLFYTQGDYGLWQCSKPCRQETYDNGEAVRRMAEAQGFRVTERGLEPPEGTPPKMSVPSELIPYCPNCGRPMTMNLRCDDTFVQDDGWYAAQRRYQDFLRRHEGGRILFLELGVGGNTPVIIKYPFWKMTAQNPAAAYLCINQEDSYVPREIRKRSLCIPQDIGAVLQACRESS